MTAYLLEHPPESRQYRHPRRARPSGVIVVHTAESAPDVSGTDGAAEATARFIQRRSDPGSYHDLVDSDTIINLIPYDFEAFHDGTGSNPHSYGLSAATQAHRWDELPDAWVDQVIRNMARAAARYAKWLRAEHGVAILARRITRAESERRIPGFISHAERDPDRRTDPGKTFPWTRFLVYFANEMTDSTPPPPTGEDDDEMMTPQQAAQLTAIYNQTRANAGLMVSLSNNVTALMTRELEDDAEKDAALAQIQRDVDAVQAELAKADQ